MRSPSLEPKGWEADRLLPPLYDRLREVAAGYLRRERRAHSLRPTALVHEAYEKLARRTRSGYRGRTHFLAVASIAMRRVLVDHARSRTAIKRGGSWKRVSVDESVMLRDERIEDVLAVHEALNRLAEIDPPGARIVEMRFFAGMTEAEVAEALDVSERWVRMQWAWARAWLRRELDG